jgi:hypothetical protein
MHGVHGDDGDEFPRAGYRARRWRRFERDLHAWLATPEGRFAAWRAQQALDERAGRRRAEERRTSSPLR